MIKLLQKIKSDYLFAIFLLLYLVVLFVFSNFRDMVSDESLYFHETYLISELLRNGQWIGDYGVGIHGFLFKLPAALVFLLTGPSVEVVTTYHLLLSGLVGIFSYKILSNIFKNKYLGILGTLFLLCNFHFVISAQTYLREIPSILMILIFINHIVKNGNKWILGLIFLLLLDVKEYIFLIFALSYVIWLFIDSTEKNFFKNSISVFKDSVIVFLPSLIWIILMFTTSIIPVNMFLASTIGLLDNGFSYLIMHFDIDISTMNALEGGMDIPLLQIGENSSEFLRVVFGGINVVLAYVGKVLYPRVFSFLSIPKVVIFPVLFSSILILKEYITKRKKNLRNYAILSLIILVWVLIYILRASHGRYLLPIVPAVSVIYIFILFKQTFSQKQKEKILIGTLVYILAGYFFETSYIVYKVVLELIIFGLFFVSLYKPNIKIIKYAIVVLISGISFASTILFSLIQGQIYGYTNYGENRSAIEVASELPKDKVYWSNNRANQPLISVLSEEKFIWPEWKWGLNEFIPKREWLKIFEEKQSYTFPIDDIESFKQNVMDYNIEEIVLNITEKDFEYYPYQEYYNVFLTQDWLELEKETEFEGMTIYIFNVIR